MPLSAQVELYAAVLPELLPLYPLHWEEIALDTERPAAALDPQFGAYEARDAAGEIVLVTLRELGRLVGYFLVFVGPGLHYRSCLTAQMDILYVTPGVRGRFGGLRLIRTMIAELRRRGVDRFFAGEKVGKSSGLGRLYEIAGMRLVERHYAIWLGK